MIWIDSVSHSVVSNSLRPHGLYPTGSSALGILQARIPEWGHYIHFVFTSCQNKLYKFICFWSAFLFLRSFPGGMWKNLPATAADTGSVPGSERSPGGENGNPLKCACLENSMGRGAWWNTVLGIAKSWARLRVHAYTHTHTQIWIKFIYKISKYNYFIPTLFSFPDLCLLRS